MLKSASGVPQNPEPIGRPSGPFGYDELVHIAGVTEDVVEPTVLLWVIGIVSARALAKPRTAARRCMVRAMNWKSLWTRKVSLGEVVKSKWIVWQLNQKNWLPLYHLHWPLAADYAAFHDVVSDTRSFRLHQWSEYENGSSLEGLLCGVKMSGHGLLSMYYAVCKPPNTISKGPAGLLMVFYFPITSLVMARWLIIMFDSGWTNNMARPRSAERLKEDGGKTCALSLPTVP